VVPDIFRFKQTLMFHTGSKPYHPANRRVSLTVALWDLQRRYGLSEEALQYIVQVRCDVSCSAPLPA
jgi:hypothetical protein